MTLQEIQNKLNSKKRGTYFTITFKKNYGEYAKTTTTTVRLANYYHVVGKEPKQDTKKNTNDKYLGNNLIFNENTQKNAFTSIFNELQEPHTKERV